MKSISYHLLKAVQAVFVVMVIVLEGCGGLLVDIVTNNFSNGVKAVSWHLLRLAQWNLWSLISFIGV